MRLVLALITILASFPSSAVEISNFKSGLACTNTKLTKDGDGWICQQTQEVLVTDQGSCVYDRATKPCTWFGFEFDYTSDEKTTKLHCLNETSRPTSPGNPHEVLAKSVTSQSYDFDLVGTSGHFYNPMYSVFAAGSPSDSLLVEKFTCRAGDVVLFQAIFNLHYPIVAE